MVLPGSCSRVASSGRALPQALLPTLPLLPTCPHLTLALPPSPAGNILLPQAGYGTNAKTRHLLPSGFFKFTVNSVKELEMLLMQNRRFAAEIAGAVGIRARKAIVKRAAELNVQLTNGQGKLRKNEL